MLHDKSNEKYLKKESSIKNNPLPDTFSNQGTDSIDFSSLMQNLNTSQLFNMAASDSLLQDMDFGSLLNGIDLGSLIKNIDMGALLKGDTSSLLKNADKDSMMKMASNLLKNDKTSEEPNLGDLDLSALLNMPISNGTEQTPALQSLLGQLETIEKEIAHIKSTIDQLNQEK